MLYLHFQRVFVEFVALLTKIWLKILIFTVAAKCWTEGCFAPPPFIPRSDQCNLSYSLILILTMHSNFENTTYKDH